MNLKDGASFWNGVMFSTKKIRFKEGTMIIILFKLTPLIEEKKILVLGQVY